MAKYNIGGNTYINNYIIMNKKYVGNNCVIENAFLDKDIVVFDYKKLIGTYNNTITIGKKYNNIKNVD